MVAFHTLIGASLSEPHTSMTALQDACVCIYIHVFLRMCGHIPKIYIEQTKMKVRVHFKFAHVLKFCAMNMTEYSSLCNSMLINLLSARDRYRLEWKEKATARLQHWQQREQEQMRLKWTEVRQARLGRWRIHGEESVAFSISIGVELYSEGSIMSTCTEH